MFAWYKARKLVGLMLLLSAMITVSCGTQKESKSQNTVVIEPEVVEFIQVLNNLTKEMSSHDPPPVILDRLRHQIEKNGQSYRNSAAKLRERLISMDEVERGDYRLRAQIQTEEAMRQFAVAQQRLRSVMNESQKVELSEALMMLR